jgi:phosphonate transport system permease protein
MPMIAIPPPAQIAPLLRGYNDAIAPRRRQLVLGLALLAASIAVACVGAEVDPATLWQRIGNFSSYFGRLLHLDSGAFVWTDPKEWFWGLRRWSGLMGETLLIAYVGTLTGAFGAFAGCFLASTNLTRPALLCTATRRVLELFRTVPEIVLAMIFVVAFGLGALPGVLAIAVHTAGALGKLFAEVVENIDMRPVEGIAASGGNWLARIRFGALPQVLSGFASYMLLRFEVNVRGAAVIGFVGAGGIGQELIVAIRKFYYSDVSAILLMVIACVMLIDFASERLRHQFVSVGKGA